MLKFLNLYLNLLLEYKRNLFGCLPVTFVVLLVTLDQIVRCWGKNQNLWPKSPLGILMFLNLFLFVTFVVFLVTFVLTIINWNLSILFQSRICDGISLAISLDKLFHMLLKNLSMLASERKLQEICFSQKKFVISQIHSTSHGSSPTKPKTRVVWVRKDSLKWVLLTCLWFNSFNYLGMFSFSFWLFYFLRLFCLLKIKKSKNIEKFQKDKNILFCVFPFFFFYIYFRIT